MSEEDFRIDRVRRDELNFFNFSKTSPDLTTRMTKIPYQISTQITTRKSKLTRSTCYGRHERYRNNLITIPSEKVTTINTNNYSSPNGKSYPTSKSSTNFVPSLMLTNVMSLAPKIDEVRPFVLDLNLDLTCITDGLHHGQRHWYSRLQSNS
jgi:hypothetical protein